MELLQIPTHRRDQNGQLIPIVADPAKLIIHHILLMKEGDWYNRWTPPPKKQSMRVNLMNLDEPLINEIFEAYQQELDNHKELGTPIINPNPKDALCGYIFNCYSYPKDDSNIEIPPGFIVEAPDALLKKKLRRIEQRMEARARENATIEKDDMMEQYQAHLISKGVDAESKEYVEKSLQYWKELGRPQNPLLGGVVPSRSRAIVLSTELRDYDLKAVRARYRYLSAYHPDFCLEWKVNHPDDDLETYEARMAMITEFDNQKAEEDETNEET